MKAIKCPRLDSNNLFATSSDYATKVTFSVCFQLKKCSEKKKSQNISVKYKWGWSQENAASIRHMQLLSSNYMNMIMHN